MTATLSMTASSGPSVLSGLTDTVPTSGKSAGSAARNSAIEGAATASESDADLFVLPDLFDSLVTEETKALMPVESAAMNPLDGPHASLALWLPPTPTEGTGRDPLSTASLDSKLSPLETVTEPEFIESEDETVFSMPTDLLPEDIDAPAESSAPQTIATTLATTPPVLAGGAQPETPPSVSTENNPPSRMATESSLARQQTNPQSASNSSHALQMQSKATPTSGNSTSADSGDSRQNASGQDGQGQPTLGGGQAGANGPINHSPQNAPFRMEMGASLTQARADGAVSALTPQTNAQALDLHENSAMPAPDIAIELTEQHRLHVTIGTQNPESAARLTARQPELARELAMLGTDVEAIRVELRGERGSDMSSSGGQGDSAARQGDRQMQQQSYRQPNAQPEADSKNQRLHIRMTTSTVDEANSTGERALLTRVDRYA